MQQREVETRLESMQNRRNKQCKNVYPKGNKHHDVKLRQKWQGNKQECMQETQQGNGK